MKVRDLMGLMEGVDENLEVGISYWDFTLMLKSAGIKNGIFHLEFGDTRNVGADAPDSEDAPEAEEAPIPEGEALAPTPGTTNGPTLEEYTIGSLTTVSDPNGNNIKCWPINNSAGLVGYLRKKDLVQDRNSEEAAARNTAFRYWKLVSNREEGMLKAIRKFITDNFSMSARLWTPEGSLYGEAGTNVAPLVYFPEA